MKSGYLMLLGLIACTPQTKRVLIDENLFSPCPIAQTQVLSEEALRSAYKAREQALLKCNEEKRKIREKISE